MDELGADAICKVAPIMAPSGGRFPLEALAESSLGGRLCADSRDCPTAAFV